MIFSRDHRANRTNCTKLFSSGATGRLLQSGWCFAIHVNCRFMHHGRRFHCATPATVLHFLSGLLQAKLQYRGGVASSEQLPSREPYRLFDEKPVAPDFFSFFSGSLSEALRLRLVNRAGAANTAFDALLRCLAVSTYCLRQRRRASKAVLSAAVERGALYSSCSAGLRRKNNSFVQGAFA